MPARSWAAACAAQTQSSISASSQPGEGADGGSTVIERSRSLSLESRPDSPLTPDKQRRARPVSLPLGARSRVVKTVAPTNPPVCSPAHLVLAYRDHCPILTSVLALGHLTYGHTSTRPRARLAGASTIGRTRRSARPSASRPTLDPVDRSLAAGGILTEGTDLDVVRLTA